MEEAGRIHDVDRPARILVFGSLDSTQSIYEQISMLTPPFNYLFVLDSPSKTVFEHAAPIPAFFLDDCPKQVCHPELNLTILPKSGVLTLPNLTVAFLVDSSDRHLVSEARVDLLLTREFPRGFHRFWDQRVESPWSIGDYEISKLCLAVTPRYHFSLGFHAEIPPFRNGDVITRFIGLAKQGNQDKQKFRYAFVLNKSAAQPNHATDCPFSAKPPKQDISDANPLPSKKPRSGLLPLQPTLGYERWSMTADDPSMERPPSNYVCHRCRQPGHFIKNCPSSSRCKSAAAQPCWFCLASPSIETHLIATIGKEVYLALPKGPMHPQHVLIIPIAHVASSLQLTESARNELLSYKSAIRDAFRNNVIFYERNIRTRNATHLQIQAIPVASNQMTAMTAERFITIAAQEHQVQFEPVDAQFNLYALDADAQFIVVDLGHDRLFYQHPDGQHIPLQVVRSTLASMLANRALADWQQCRTSIEDETDLRDTFQQMFAPFDFAASQ